MKYKNLKLFKKALLLFFFLGFVCILEAQEDKYTYKHQGKRDPFVPLISSSGYLINMPSADSSSLLLEGILYDSSGDSIAIINGELVRVGETVGNAVVTAIELNKIIVIQDNERLEIELRREE